MKKKSTIIALVLTVPAAAVLWLSTPTDASFKQPALWQSVASPGALSAPHAHLESNCNACHQPFEGATSVGCIVCHADESSVLQRQPTAFHASISSCAECHLEHRGRDQRPTTMDHQALVTIGLRQLGRETLGSEAAAFRELLLVWEEQAAAPHARIATTEASLSCLTCHANDDQHRSLFGRDCAQCHGVDRWNIPEYRHPPARSKDCANCHEAPPSHYMMHFEMISQRVAGKPHARVDQCFHCHQTTSWNDILDAGWYKHH